MQRTNDQNNLIIDLLTANDSSKYIEACHLLRMIELQDKDLEAFLSQRSSAMIKSFNHRLRTGNNDILLATLSAFASFISGPLSANFIFESTKDALFARSDLICDSFWDYLTTIFLNTFSQLSDDILQSAVSCSSVSSIRFLVYYFELNPPIEAMKSISDANREVTLLKSFMIHDQSFFANLHAYLSEMTQNDFSDKNIESFISFNIILEILSNNLENLHEAASNVLPEFLALADFIESKEAVDTLSDAIDEFLDRFESFLTNFALFTDQPEKLHEFLVSKFLVNKSDFYALAIAALNQRMSHDKIFDHSREIFPVLENSLKQKSGASFKYLELLLSFLPVHNLDDSSARKLLTITLLALNNVDQNSAVAAVTLLSTILSEERFKSLPDFNNLLSATMRCNLILNKFNIEDKDDLRNALGENLKILRKK